jgi:hypothetical protein
LQGNWKSYVILTAEKIGGITADPDYAEGPGGLDFFLLSHLDIQ